MHSGRLVLRAFVVLTVLLVPILLGATPALAQYREVETNEETVESRTTSLIAPAVGERADGTLVGVGMEVEITLRSGSGGVFLDTRPLTQLDMQGSARLAASMAASTAREDFSEYDMEMKVRSSTTAVGGPSAGGAITVAIMSLLLETPLRDDVMMTGMINPDGSIGPVGGIIQKAEAAHKEGADTFLIPEGQGTVRHVEQVTQGGDSFQRQTEVDVAEYADDEWGLEIREVSDLHEAFRYSTDFELSRPEVPEATRSPVFDQVMGEAADGQLVEAVARLGRVRSDLEQSGLDQDEPQLHTQLVDLLDSTEDRLQRAQEEMDAGSPYTASSLAFQANVEISRVAEWILITRGSNPAGRLDSRIDEVEKQVNLAIGNASEATLDSVVLLEVVGAAQVRAAEAARLVEDARRSLDENRLSGAVESLAFARERVRSVAWWLSMADSIGDRVELTPLDADPDDLAREYRQVAREAMTYAEVLGGQIGGGQTQARLLELAASSLRDSQLAQDADLDAGSLYLAVESQVAAHSTLSLLGSESLLQDRLDRQRDAALVAVEEARRLGLEPFLAASFQEFAEALESDDAVSALLLYGNAAMIASLSTALGSGEGGVFGIGAGSGEKPLVTRVGGFGPDPWTAYFALATIVFGFMAGILVTLIVVQARTPSRHRGHNRHTAVRVRSRRGASIPPAFPNGRHNGSARPLANRRRAAQIPPVVTRRLQGGYSPPARGTPTSELK